MRSGLGHSHSRDAPTHCVASGTGYADSPAGGPSGERKASHRIPVSSCTATTGALLRREPGSGLLAWSSRLIRLKYGCGLRDKLTPVLMALFEHQPGGITYIRVMWIV